MGDPPLVENHTENPQNPSFLSDSNQASVISTPTPTQKHSHDESILEAFLMGKTPKTRETYKRVLREFFDFIHPYPLRTIGIIHLQGFLECKKYEAHESRRLRQAVISSFFSYSVRSGYLPVNLAAFLPKIAPHHKISERYLSEEEVMKMIALTHKLRDQVILKVLYAGGLRLSELLALNWEHVQERRDGEGQLLIQGKGDKKRVVVVSAGVFQALLALKQEGARPFDPVCTSREDGNPRLSRRFIQVLVDQARIRAGILRRVSPHWLRHAHASHALDRGAPIHLVQATLGHSSVATTGKYLHARPQESSGRFLGI